MFKRTLAFLLAALVLGGCAAASASPVPTLLPESLIPTIIAMTAEAGLATAQALTPTPLPPTPTETPTPLPTVDFPTQTFTPHPFIPPAQIQFLAPGPMSKFISPVQMQLLMVSGESNVIQVDLFGEDGRLLGRKVERMNRNLSGAYRTYKIPFEIRAAAETGMIQISSKDEVGRMQALNTVPVVLLSSGRTETNPPGNFLYERAVFYDLEDGAEVTGGVLALEGRYWPFNSQPYFLELILPDGQIASVRVLTVEGVEPQEFTTTLPYKVSEPTLVRLSLRQMDPVLKGPVYVFTQLLWLKP